MNYYKTMKLCNKFIKECPAIKDIIISNNAFPHFFETPDSPIPIKYADPTIVYEITFKISGSNKAINGAFNKILGG